MLCNTHLEENLRLFCKPYSTGSHAPLYKCYVDEYKSFIIFRSLRLDEDLNMIHEWVNSIHAKRFWQLDGTIESLFETYDKLLNNPQAHSFIGLLGKQPICQIDLYNIQADELGNHVRAEKNDCGLHLLMCPPTQSKKRFSFYALKYFLDFYFSYSEAARIYAEPDQENEKANLLARNVGFTFLKTINLSYKRAHLYCFEKANFLSMK